MQVNQERAKGGALKVCWTVLTTVTLSSVIHAVPQETPPSIPIPQRMPSKPTTPPTDNADSTSPTAEPPLAPLSKPTPTPMPAPAPTPTPAPTPAPTTTTPPEAESIAVPAVGPVVSPASQVYVLNGIDLFGFSRLRDLSDRLRGNGYDTHYGQWYDGRRFEREIRQLQSQQPGTPVAIVGYSFGVYRARAMANRLTRDGVPVSMVGYIGGDYLRNSTSDVPGGVRVVNVTGDGFLPTGRNLFFNGTNLTGASNLRLPGVRHSDLPKRGETYDALLAGLGTPSQPAVVESQSSYVAPPDNVTPRSSSGTRPFRLVGRGER